MLRMKALIFLGFTEKSDFFGGEGGSRKTNLEGELPKKGEGGAWTFCQFKGEGLLRKSG